MKKLFFSIFIFLIFVLKLNATSYNCKISGDNVLHPFDEDKSKSFFIANMNIDIDNIDDLSSFTMYVDYDKNLYGIYGCNLLNYATGGCAITFNKDNRIWYTYKKSSNYNFKENHFYTVSFISNEKTPNTGSSVVNVFFENAKDINNNEVEIKGCNRTFTFKDFSMYYVPSDTNETESSNTSSTTNNSSSKNTATKETTKNNNETIVLETNSSNYISNLIIDGYDLDFDKETQLYNLKVDNDVNKLDINIELEDENAKYIISGASDLNSFGNKITISVTSSNGEVREYVINVIKEKQEINTFDLKQEVKSAVKNNNLKKYIPYVIGGFFIFIIIILIFLKLSSRKLDKYLDNI